MDISIIIPVFNEEQNLLILHQEIFSIFENLNKDFEIIYIDDGSTDQSFRILEKIKRKDSRRVRLIRFDRNYGQTAALDAGFKYSKGKAVLTIDGDFQYHPKDLLRIYNKLQDKCIDMVLGRRVNTTAGLVKSFSSKIARFARNKILGVYYRDCSMAGYKKGCLQNLVLYRGFQPLIPALLKIEGYNFREIDVKELPRRCGNSKYNIRNRLFKGLLALLIIKWIKGNRLKYKITYLE